MPTDTPEALSRAFAEAINARDIESAIDLWIDDATIVQADGQAIRGKAAVAGALHALIDSQSTRREAYRRLRRRGTS
jgi:ketosteroid isomerase-like protein